MNNKSTTNKSSETCRVCNNSVGKKSKAFINIHNIQTTDKSKEFETKLIDCNKCPNCGHSWI